MDCLHSFPRWAKWMLVFVLLSLGIFYTIFLQSKLPALLGLARAIKAGRYEVQMLLTIFSLVVVSAPLSIVPTGAAMVSGALAGYVYGLPGLALAWPGLSIGLFLVFSLARLASTRGGVEQAKVTGAPANEADVAHNSLPACLQGRHTRVFIRGTLRLLREQPKRTAILMTFASHAPFTQFVFGWTTDIRWTDAGLACFIDGVKIIVPFLKGMAISDVLDIISEREGQQSCWDDGTHCAGMMMKICISISVGIVFLLMARAIMKEINEMDEEGEEDRALLPSDNDSLNEGDAGRENEVDSAYEIAKP
mmetsp:Transcript_34556/g.64531  ORF Transcript_34556/g.64531 Transcript_34556/m.64531 type:complete len:307 (-) Transcript_34556:20-940(-)